MKGQNGVWEEIKGARHTEQVIPGIKKALRPRAQDTQCLDVAVLKFCSEWVTFLGLNFLILFLCVSSRKT